MRWSARVTERVDGPRSPVWSDPRRCGEFVAVESCLDSDLYRRRRHLRWHSRFAGATPTQEELVLFDRRSNFGLELHLVATDSVRDGSLRRGCHCLRICVDHLVPARGLDAEPALAADTIRGRRFDEKDVDYADVLYQRACYRCLLWWASGRQR